MKQYFRKHILRFALYLAALAVLLVYHFVSSMPPGQLAGPAVYRDGRYNFEYKLSGKIAAELINAKGMTRREFTQSIIKDDMTIVGQLLLSDDKKYFVSEKAVRHYLILSRRNFFFEPRYYYYELAKHDSENINKLLAEYEELQKGQKLRNET